MLSLFKKKILIGYAEDTVQAIIEHLEKRNVPSEDTAQAIIEHLEKSSIPFEDTVQTTIKHLEKSNVPFELGIEAILKPLNNDFYELFYTVEVRKEYAEQAETIVAQYVLQEDLKHRYKAAKKKSRKLERKKKALYLFAAFISFIVLGAIEMGKSLGADIVPSIGCALVLMGGVFMTTKYYKEMKKESGDLRENNKMLMIFGIGMIFYAVTSFISVLRF